MSGRKRLCGGSSSLLAGPVVRKTLSRLCLVLSVELQVILQHKDVSDFAVDNAGDQSVFLSTAVVASRQPQLRSRSRTVHRPLHSDSVSTMEVSIISIMFIRASV